MRIPTGTIHRRHAVRSASTSGTGATAENTAVHVLCWPPEGLRFGRPRAAVENAGPSRCPEEMIAVIRQFHGGIKGSGAHRRRGTLGLVRGGDRGRSCAFQRGRHHPERSGVPRRGDWGVGRDTVRTRAEGGLENVVCRRCRRRIEIPRRADEDDDQYRTSLWGTWHDSVGEEDRDYLDAGPEK